jgi:hypothetical protein
MLGEDGNIMTYSQNVYASQRMNYKLWDITQEKTAAFRCGDEETYDNGIDFLLDFATKRLAWLSDTTSGWNGEKYSAPMDPATWDKTTRYHEPVKLPGKAPTCTENGESDYIGCAGCDIVYRDSYILAAAHRWTKATCVTKRICIECGVTDETSELMPHAWLIDPTIATERCSICNMLKNEEHKLIFDAKNEMNSETCLVYKCTECDFIILLDAEIKTGMAGDMNGDSNITAADARIALRISAKLEMFNAYNYPVADMNKDNKFSAADARAILRFSAKLPI